MSARGHWQSRTDFAAVASLTWTANILCTHSEYRSPASPAVPSCQRVNQCRNADIDRIPISAPRVDARRAKRANACDYASIADT